MDVSPAVPSQGHMRMTPTDVGDVRQSPQAALAVLAENLVKLYPGGVEAVKGISLWASEGEIIGVVGPNGAGKSTTLNMLATLIRPTSGVARICGISLEDQAQVRRLIGVALQEVGLDPLMTAREHLEVQGALCRMPSQRIRHRSAELLDEFELTTVARRPAGLYSGGMQRRLSLALGLIGDPRVVIFDEPTSGLDPASRRIVWKSIRDLRRRGTTVVFSTHYLEEAQQLCNRVYLIFGGLVVQEGPPEAVREATGAAVLRATVRGGTGADLMAALSHFAGRGEEDLREDVRLVSEEPATAELKLRTDAHGVAEKVLSELRRRSLEIVELRLAPPSLEDAFLAVAGDSPPEEALTGAPIETAIRTRRGGRNWR